MADHAVADDDEPFATTALHASQASGRPVSRWSSDGQMSVSGRFTAMAIVQRFAETATPRTIEDVSDHADRGQQRPVIARPGGRIVAELAFGAGWRDQDGRRERAGVAGRRRRRRRSRLGVGLRSRRAASSRRMTAESIGPASLAGGTSTASRSCAGRVDQAQRRRARAGRPSAPAPARTARPSGGRAPPRSRRRAPSTARGGMATSWVGWLNATTAPQPTWPSSSTRIRCSPLTRSRSTTPPATGIGGAAVQRDLRVGGARRRSACRAAAAGSRRPRARSRRPPAAGSRACSACAPASASRRAGSRRRRACAPRSAARRRSRSSRRARSRSRDAGRGRRARRSTARRRPSSRPRRPPRRDRAAPRRTRSSAC